MTVIRFCSPHFDLMVAVVNFEKASDIPPTSPVFGLHCKGTFISSADVLSHCVLMLPLLSRECILNVAAAVEL